MNRPDDDERDLTAYVLGEAGDEETTVVDLRAREDARLKAEIEEVRTVSELIRRELGAGERLGLTAEQRRAIFQAAAARAPVPARAASKAVAAVAAREPAPARNGSGAGLWERLELLLVYLGFLGGGLLLPRAASWCRDLLAPADDLASEGAGFAGRAHEWLARVSELSPGYYKVAILSACAGTAAYAWQVTRPREGGAMPAAGLLLAVLAYFAGVAGLAALSGWV